MSKQFSITRDEMYTMMTEAHESITNVMTEDTGVMIGIIRDSMAEDAVWADSDGQGITDADIVEVLEDWRADNRDEDTTPAPDAEVVEVESPAAEAAAPQYIYTAVMTKEMVAESVASDAANMHTLTDAEVFEWAGKWNKLAMQASWNPLSNEMASLYIAENMRRRGL